MAFCCGVHDDARSTAVPRRDLGGLHSLRSVWHGHEDGMVLSTCCRIVGRRTSVLTTEDHDSGSHDTTGRVLKAESLRRIPPLTQRRSTSLMIPTMFAMLQRRGYIRGVPWLRITRPNWAFGDVIATWTASFGTEVSALKISSRLSG